MSEGDAAVDKSSWGPGPWQDEPDRVDFRHAGYPCLLLRGEFGGQLNGYIAVPPGHPWHGKPRDTIEASVHGGLTYEGAPEGDIAHVPEPGESADVWWIGFDAGHAWDVSPAMDARLNASDQAAAATGFRFPMADMRRRWGSKYRTVEYMRAQVEGLAEQAAAAAQGIIPIEARRNR